MLARHPPTPPPYESLPFKPLSLFRHADILLSVRPSVHPSVRSFVSCVDHPTDREKRCRAKRWKIRLPAVDHSIARRWRTRDKDEESEQTVLRGARIVGRLVGRLPSTRTRRGRRAAGRLFARNIGVIVIVVAVVPVVIAISRYDNSTFSARLYLLPSPDPGCASRRSVYGARREGDSRRLDET